MSVRLPTPSVFLDFSQNRDYLDSLVRSLETSFNDGSVGGTTTTQTTRVVGAAFDGGGSVLAPSSKARVLVPFSGSITKVRVIADQVGSLELDIWVDDYSSYPPVSGDSICGSSKPTLSSENKYEDSALSGWSTSLTSGDCVIFNVDSCSAITQATIILEIEEN